MRVAVGLTFSIIYYSLFSGSCAAIILRLDGLDSCAVKFMLQMKEPWFLRWDPANVLCTVNEPRCTQV